jgi:hypothetical protein
MANDPVCYNCRHPFQRATPRTKVIKNCGAIFACAACVGSNALIPESGGILLHAIVGGISAVVGGMVGMFVGWVASRFVSNH